MNNYSQRDEPYFSPNFTGQFNPILIKGDIGTGFWPGFGTPLVNRVKIKKAP